MDTPMQVSTRSLKTSRRLSVGAMALAAAFMVASPVAAASGSVGDHGYTEATCYTGKRLVISLPYVAAAPVASTWSSFTVGGSWGGGTNSQVVGVRVWLIKWNPTTRLWHYTDQNRDGYYDRTAEFQMQTTSNGPYVGYNWWNADAKRTTQAGDMTFTAQESGSYALMTQYFWYTNGQVTGYDLLPSKDHFVVEYFTVSKPYCTF